MVDRRRRAFSFGAAALLTACASKPAPPKQPVTVRTVVMVPARGPAAFAFESKTSAQFLFPLAAAAAYVDSKDKAKQVNAKLSPAGVDLAERLNRVVRARLEASGLRVMVLDDIARLPDDPDYVDLEALKTDADAIVHVRFEEAGFFSPRGDLQLYPKVSVRSTVYVPVNKDFTYDDSTYFGYDVRPKAEWGILAEPTFVYASFEDLIARSDDARDRLRVATDALGDLAVKRLQPSLRSA